MRLVFLLVVLATTSSTRAQSVTIEALIARADQSPLVGLAGADVQDAAAMMRGERAVFPSNPSVWVGLGQRLPGGGGVEVQAQLQQTLEIAGQRGRRRAAAARTMELAQGTQARTRWNVRTEVRRLGYAALLGAQRIDVAERSLALAESVRATAVRRVEAGEASPLEVLVADSDLVHARQEEIRARRLERDARTQLAGIVGWDSEIVPPIEGSLPEVVNPPPLPELLTTLAESPDMRVRNLAVRAAQAGLDAADRAAWPNPSLGLYYGREGDAAQVAHVWLVTLGLPLPLWRRNDRARARARADVFRRERELEAAAVELRARLSRLRLEVESAVARVGLYEATGLESATQNLSRTERAFELGDLSLLEVSQTRQRLLRVVEEEIEARADYYDVAMRLEMLLGRAL